MLPLTSRRNALISYAACLTAFAGLMAVVAFGGDTITVKRSAIDFSSPQYAGVVRP